MSKHVLAGWSRLYTYAATCGRVSSCYAVSSVLTARAWHLLLHSSRRPNYLRSAHHRVSTSIGMEPAVLVGAEDIRTRRREVGGVQRQHVGNPANRRADTQTHRRIRDAANEAELYSIVQGTAVGDINALVLTAAFHRLAILQVDKRRLARGSPGGSTSSERRIPESQMKREELRMLERVAASKIHEFEASHCALILWSLAKLNSLTRSPGNASATGSLVYEAPEKLLDALMLRARDTAASARPRHVANIIWACATLGLRPSPDLVDALSKRITVSFHAYGSQAISNILWAFASLRLEPSEELAQVLLERSTAVLAESSPQGVANTVWALGCLTIHPPPSLLRELHARLVQTSSQLTPQGVATSLWGHAALGVVPSHAALTALVKACMSNKGRFSPHELAITLWALASLGKVASQMQHEVLRTDLAGIFHAASPLVNALSWSANDAAERFDAQSVSMLLWAIANLSRHPPAPPAQSAQPVYEPARENQRLQRGQPQDASDDLSAKHVNARQGAAAKAPGNKGAARGSLKSHGRGIRSKGAAGRLIFRLLARLPQCAREFSPQDLAVCYWSLASLGVSAGAARSALAEAARAHLPRLNSQDVSTILWALASLNDDASQMALPSSARSSRERSGRVGESDERAGSTEGMHLARQTRSRADGMMGDGHGAGAKVGVGRADAPGKARGEVEDRLSWALLMRAGDIADTFTCQQVSNSLWAAASLGLVAALAPSRASVWYSTAAVRAGHEAGGWEAPTARSESQEGLRHVIDQLALQLYVLADGQLQDTTFEHVHLCQLHQFFLTCDLVLSRRGGGGRSALLPGRMRRVYKALRTPARVCFEMQTVEPEISALQQQVADVLESMQLGARPEVIEARSGYKIDILLRVEADRNPPLEQLDGCVSGRHSEPAARADDGGRGDNPGGSVMPMGWLVEVDGPSHFLQGELV